jgi:hypothetical protein
MKGRAMKPEFIEGWGGLRRLALIIGLATSLAVPLGGCQTLGAIWTVSTTPSTTATVVMLDVDKILVIGHRALSGVGKTLIVLANSNVCTGQCAVTAKGYYDQAGAALIKADSYHDLGNAVLTKQWADAAIQAIALATTSHN